MTLSLTADKYQKFKKCLEDSGYVFEDRPHHEFLAKKPGITVNLYSSGKITLGGSDKEEQAWVERYLESLGNGATGAARFKYEKGSIIVQTPYDQAFVSELKSQLKTRRWLPAQKAWRVDVKERQKLLDIAGRFYRVVEDNPPSEEELSASEFQPEPLSSTVDLSSYIKPGMRVEIWTDGACVKNPGPGGYGVVIKCQGQTWEKSGGFRFTTNNRMEIMAALVALESLHAGCEVTLFSDSLYLVKSVTLGWAKDWKSRGWVKGDKTKALNPDLWERMLKLCASRKVEFKWVRGHSVCVENERCDKLAEYSARKAGLPADKGYDNNEGKLT